MKTLLPDQVHRGLVCLSFDDRDFDGWVTAIPLFARYGAHASFMVYGEINEEALTAMRALRNAGHTVGLHSLTHRDAPEFFDANGADAYWEAEILPQLAACDAAGFAVHSFAYPNNRRDARTDAYLSRRFDRFRAGRAGLSPDALLPLSELSRERVMHGFGIGEYYHTEEGALMEQLRHVAETNACVTFFSHDIRPEPSPVGMPTALLETILAACARLGVCMAGFDELP